MLVWIRDSFVIKTDHFLAADADLILIGEKGKYSAEDQKNFLVFSD